MSTRKISILIPVFNAENTIERCIESIRQQTFQDYEIVAVNDGSADHTADILELLSSKESRLKVFYQENRGVSAARNTALNHSEGDYVMFVDCDDHLDKNYLSTYYEAACESNSDVVIGGCTQINSNNRTKKIIPPATGDITDDIWKYLSKNVRCLGFICSKIIRRSLIKNHNIRFDEKMYSQEDLNFNMDLYHYANHVMAINDTGYIYEYSVSSRKPDTIGYINNQLKLFRICIEKQTLDEQIKANIEKRLESYVFGYLLNSEDINDSLNLLVSIDGLDEVLRQVKIHNEKSYVSRLLADSHLRWIKTHFAIRRAARKLIKRG